MSATDLEGIAFVVVLALLAGFLAAWSRSGLVGMAIIGPVIALLLLTVCLYLLGRAGAAQALASGIAGVGRAVRG